MVTVTKLCRVKLYTLSRAEGTGSPQKSRKSPKDFLSCPWVGSGSIKTVICHWKNLETRSFETIKNLWLGFMQGECTDFIDRTKVFRICKFFEDCVAFGNCAPSTVFGWKIISRFYGANGRLSNLIAFIAEILINFSSWHSGKTVWQFFHFLEFSGRNFPWDRCKAYSGEFDSNWWEFPNVGRKSFCFAISKVFAIILLIALNCGCSRYQSILKFFVS